MTRRFIQPSPAQLANYSASHGYNMNLGVPVDATWLVGMYVPTDASDLIFYLANWEIGAGAGAAVPNVDVALFKSDGTSTSTPTSTTPIRVLGNVTVPAAAYVAVPVTNADLATARGTDGMVILAFTTHNGDDIVTNPNVSWGQYYFTAASVNPIPAIGSFAQNPNATFSTGCYFKTRRPRILVGIDSLTQGYDLSATLLRAQCAYVRIGQDNDWAVDSSGKPGVKLSQWNAGTVQYLDTGTVPQGVVGLSEASINDLPTVANLAAYIVLVQARVALWRAAGVRKIVWTTLTPSTAYLANDALRQSINADLLLNFGGYGIDAVCDIATVVSDPAAMPANSALLPAYAQADGTHINAVGNAAMATALTATLTPFC